MRWKPCWSIKKLLKLFTEAGGKVVGGRVEVQGCAETCRILAGAVPAQESDWETTPGSYPGD